MTVAACIFAFLLGVVLLLASELVGGALDTVGLVLMIAGALGAALGLLLHALTARRGRRQVGGP